VTSCKVQSKSFLDIVINSAVGTYGSLELVAVVSLAFILLVALKFASSAAASLSFFFANLVAALGV